MAFGSTLKRALGLAKEGPLPGGRKVEDWLEQAEMSKPPDYAPEVRKALALYAGRARIYIRETLARNFPRTWSKMDMVSLNVVRKIIVEQARVFAGEPKLEIEDANGSTLVGVGKLETKNEDGSVETTYSTAWSDVLDDAEFLRKAIEANRIVRLCKRAFVRVTWDDDDGRVRLTLFTPDRVYPIFAADTHELDEAEGVLLEVEPTIVDGKPVRRFEFWSAGENPQNFIVDEHDQVTKGESDGVNPFRDDRGNAIVPIIALSDEDEDAGYWLPPSEQLIDTALAIDIKLTNVHHVAKMSGYGQPVATVSGDNPAQWVGAPSKISPQQRVMWGIPRDDSVAAITMGPDEVVMVPRGWTFDIKQVGGDLAALANDVENLIHKLAIMESIPAGVIFQEQTGTRATSGYALEIERAPLQELRQDQVELYRRPIGNLLTLVRQVWDANQESNATRFGEGVTGCFEPGTLKAPVDPLVQAQIDQQQQANGTSSPVRVLMRDEDLDETAATQLAAKIRSENQAKAPMSSLGRLVASGGVPSPLQQSRATSGAKANGAAGSEPGSAQPQPQDGTSPAADQQMSTPAGDMVTVAAHTRAMPG